MAITDMLKGAAILTSIFFRKRLDAIKICLGIAKEQYGICNPFEYDGVWYAPSFHKKDRVEASSHYDNFRPDDVFVATYPKTGTHFVFDVLACIYKEKGLVPKDTPHSEVAAELEITPPPCMSGNRNTTGVPEGPIKGIENPAGPRLIISHFHWNSLPAKVRDGQVKVIHCTRNPKDVLCSMYPFYKKVGYMSDSVKWDDFVGWFIEGNVVNGSYFKYLKEWYPNRNSPNILNVKYEDMKKDLRGNVVRMAEFLNIELTDDQIDAVVSANTFENKKKEMGKLHPMYNKGKSGGWKSQISVAQNEMLDEWIQQEMKGMEDLEILFQ